jgi:hypothetical protein
MKILPSLLEYNLQNLAKKISIIQSQKQKFLETTNQSIINLHLDFVLPEFAASREVQPSLGLTETINFLADHFEEENLELTVHLMGLQRDMDKSFIELQNISQEILPSYSWKIDVFVDQRLYSSWQQEFQSKNLNVGVWYDLGNWRNQSFSPGMKYLLMTVLAGKSGQELSLEDTLATFETAKNNPESYFVADGGWKVDILDTQEKSLENLDIVSYSSFWKEMG